MAQFFAFAACSQFKHPKISIFTKSIFFISLSPLKFLGYIYH